METVINNIYICERNADFVLKSVTINMTLISLIHCIDCVLIFVGVTSRITCHFTALEKFLTQVNNHLDGNAV